MLTSATELLKKSIDLYVKNFAVILKYLLLTLIPMVIAGLIIAIPAIFGENFYLALLAGWWWLFALTGAVLAILIFVSSMWFSFNIMRVIRKLHNGEAIASVMETTKETEKVLWKGIGTSLLAGLYVGGPFLLGILLIAINRAAAILPLGFLKPLSGAAFLALAGIITAYGAIHAIIFSIKLFPAIYETVLAEKSVNESIKNSPALTKNRWWAILGRLLLSGIVVWLAYLIASLLLSLIISALLKIFGVAGQTTADLIYSIFTQLLSLFITPVPFAVAIMLYEELKKPGLTQTNPQP